MIGVAQISVKKHIERECGLCSDHESDFYFSRRREGTKVRRLSWKRWSLVPEMTDCVFTICGMRDPPVHELLGCLSVVDQFLGVGTY